MDSGEDAIAATQHPDIALRQHPALEDT